MVLGSARHRGSSACGQFGKGWKIQSPMRRPHAHTPKMCCVGAFVRHWAALCDLQGSWPALLKHKCSAGSVSKAGPRARTMPVCWMVSMAKQAEEDLLYLTKTIPLVAMRSVLQYCIPANRDISACTRNAAGKGGEV